MTYKDNVKAILECFFSGFKEEIIDSACDRILELKNPLDEIRDEVLEYVDDTDIAMEICDIFEKYITGSEDK